MKLRNALIAIWEATATAALMLIFVACVYFGAYGLWGMKF